MISSNTTSAEEAMKITKSVSHPNIVIKCLGFAGFCTLHAFTIKAPFVGTICSILNYSLDYAINGLDGTVYQTFNKTVAPIVRFDQYYEF